MFNKNEKIDENILLEMAENLYNNAFKKVESEQDDIKILEHLDIAANLLEKNGLCKEAEAVTGLMEIVAAKKKEQKKDKKKGKKKDKKEGECPKSSEEAVENYKRKGWMFSAKDGKTAKASEDSIAIDEDDDENLIEKLQNLW